MYINILYISNSFEVAMIVVDYFRVFLKGYKSDIRILDLMLFSQI